MRLVVHGGVGGTPDDPAQRQAVLDRAATAGTGKSDPIDAVVAAVETLESNPRFNAGVGSAVQSDGRIRTDAGVMTADRSVGAACAMPDVPHAISVARAVLAGTPHVMLAGERAVEFARDAGIETDADLWTEATRRRWEESDPPDGSATPGEQLRWARERFGGMDTVGAVATDGTGLATATSTGGRWFALAGRVGDVPQVGAGFYATHAGGVSATGAGEDIARVTLARRAVQHLEVGRDPGEAADLAVEELEELTGATAGIIVLDPDGAVGIAHNGDGMGTAVDGNP